MRKQLIVLAVLVMTSIMLSARASAAPQTTQEKPRAAETSGSYRLDFTATEIEEGKTLNSRAYTMMLTGTPIGQVRAGSRVPVESSSTEGGSRMFQYLDIGQNIDCRIVSENDRYLVLDTTSETSSIAPAAAGGEVPLSRSNPIIPPIIRQLKSRSFGAVEFGKPTVISSLDDVSSKRRFRLEVVATRIK